MATRIKATVFTASEPKEHPNADRLEIIEVLGWQVICQKGLIEAGKQYVYIEPNTIVPDEWAEKWGIKKYLKGTDHNIVGQVRLRGEPSFGFVVKAPEAVLYNDGTDLSNFYGLSKYEPPVKMMHGDSETPHALFVKYTDIENLRNYPDIFEDGEEVIVTEKIHGTNSRIGIVDGEKMAGSMEIRRKEPEDYETNTYWFPWTLDSVAKMIEDLSKSYKQVIVYGEVYGNKIQNGFVYDAEKGKVGYKLFDIMIDGNFLSHDRLMHYCKEYGAETVPVVYRGPYSLEAIRKASEGDSVYGKQYIKEGVVVRPAEERTHPRVGRLIMKYLSDDYLLSKHPDSKDV